MIRQYVGSFATGPTQYATIPRFAPDYWNINGTGTAFFTAVSNASLGQIIFTSELNTTGDFVGLQWTSVDYLTHPSLQYSTNYDYSNLTLSFAYTQSTNIPAINASSVPPTITFLYQGPPITVASIIGAHTLQVSSTSSPTQFFNGQVLSIGNSENATVQSFTATSVTFTTGLTKAHPIGTLVQPFDFLTLLSVAQSGYTAYAAQIVINFDRQLAASGNHINARQIERLFLGMNPPGYSPINPVVLSGGAIVGTMTLSNMTCTINSGASPNATLPVGIIPNPIDQWVGIADDYSLATVWTPARLVSQYVQMGYRSCVDMYMSAARYYSTVWSSGQNAYIIDNTKTLNAPTVIWLKDFIARIAALNIPLTLSISMEIYTPNQPNFWDQQDWNGNPAHTGYTPSTTVSRFMAATPRAWLISVFEAIAALLPTTGNFTVQIGEPAWWMGALYGEAGVGPCIFDIDTKNAYHTATGLFAPEIDTVVPFASLTAAQQAYVTYVGDQLGVYTDAVTVAIKTTNPNCRVSVLWYGDAIIAAFGYNGFAQNCNLPVSHWKYGATHAPDVMELEQYGDVVPTFIPSFHTIMYDIATGSTASGNLGYPPQYVRYYSGFATNENATQLVPAYFTNMTQALNYEMTLGMQQVLIWAWPEVREAGWVVSYATPDPLG